MKEKEIIDFIDGKMNPEMEADFMARMSDDQDLSNDVMQAMRAARLSGVATNGIDKNKGRAFVAEAMKQKKQTSIYTWMIPSVALAACLALVIFVFKPFQDSTPDGLMAESGQVFTPMEGQSSHKAGVAYFEEELTVLQPANDTTLINIESRGALKDLEFSIDNKGIKTATLTLQDDNGEIVLEQKLVKGAINVMIGIDSDKLHWKISAEGKDKSRKSHAGVLVCKYENE